MGLDTIDIIYDIKILPVGNANIVGVYLIR